MKRVNNVRLGEIRILKYLAKLWALTNFTFACSPFLVTVVVFVLYVTIDPVNHILDASKIFVSMSLFGLMRLPLTIFPWALTESIKLFVSLKRINKFLNAEVSLAHITQKPCYYHHTPEIKPQNDPQKISRQNFWKHHISVSTSIRNMIDPLLESLINI